MNKAVVFIFPLNFRILFVGIISVYDISKPYHRKTLKLRIRIFFQAATLLYNNVLPCWNAKSVHSIRATQRYSTPELGCNRATCDAPTSQCDIVPVSFCT